MMGFKIPKSYSNRLILPARDKPFDVAKNPLRKGQAAASG